MTACNLCGSQRKDSVQFGDFREDKKHKIAVHTFCLYLSSNLGQNGSDEDGILGFLPEDIKAEEQRVKKLKCCYCGKNSANVGCCERKCRRTFHMPCGIARSAENQFAHTYQSFCDLHVRKLRHAAAKPDEVCCICYDALMAPKERFNSVTMLRAPCCRNGWFHKLCLQKFASSSGYFFKCPLCNDNDTFRAELSIKGIFIPDQDAAWELESNAFADLLERPSSCAAENCSCRRGREFSSNANPLLICETCGAVAFHKSCLRQEAVTFHCDDCRKLFSSSDSGRASAQSLPTDGNSSSDRLHNQQQPNEDEHVEVCALSSEDEVLPNIQKVYATIVLDESDADEDDYNNDVDDNNDDDKGVENAETARNYCDISSSSSSPILNVNRRRKHLMESEESESEVDDAKLHDEQDSNSTNIAYRGSSPSSLNNSSSSNRSSSPYHTPRIKKLKKCKVLLRKSNNDETTSTEQQDSNEINIGTSVGDSSSDNTQNFFGHHCDTTSANAEDDVDSSLSDDPALNPIEYLQKKARKRKSARSNSCSDHVDKNSKAVQTTLSKIEAAAADVEVIDPLSFDASCIAKRTRRRLSTITEECQLLNLGTYSSQQRKLCERRQENVTKSTSATGHINVSDQANLNVTTSKNEAPIVKLQKLRLSNYSKYSNADKRWNLVNGSSETMNEPANTTQAQNIANRNFLEMSCVANRTRRRKPTYEEFKRRENKENARYRGYNIALRSRNCADKKSAEYFNKN